MKISYKNLKRYLNNLPDADKVGKEIVLHLAEVEEVANEAKNLEKVFVWEVVSCSFWYFVLNIQIVKN